MKDQYSFYGANQYLIDRTFIKKSVGYIMMVLHKADNIGMATENEINYPPQGIGFL